MVSFLWPVISIRSLIRTSLRYPLVANDLLAVWQGKHVKHEPYEKGAAMYVSKYVCDTKTNWGIVNNNS